MPEQQIVVNRALEILEDNTLTQGLTRQQYFEVILKAVDHEDNLSVTVLERILAICVHDLKEDVKQSVLCLNIMMTILKRLQVGKPTPNLLPSAEAVLNILQTMAQCNNAASLQTVCFSTLSAFPDDVLTTIACDSNNFWNIFHLYCNQNISIDIRLQPFKIAHRLLKTLSPEKKELFVKNGMTAWFSKVIPCVMDFYKTQIITPISLVPLEVLELWTEEIVKIDYTDNIHWQTVLENIYSPNLYPANMKNLLSNGSAHWYRLWIVFIKLLKTQITMNKPGTGSPINSMLPVVEMAFKLDVTNRCRAFQCWNVLIDSFSAETNELFVNKRIKLLIIPLRSNNAKFEETALAKLNTWWHLIKRYESRMDDRILYPFLHFCFGRHIPEKVSVIPGLISPKVKQNCVKAFVELVGHVNCDGCGLVPRLKKKVFSIKVMVNHWNDWLYSLKMAVKISAEDIGLGMEPITCAWKSFVMTVAELPENNIRKDLFNELLTVIKQLAQECKGNIKLAEIVINVLIISLFDQESTRPLLLVKESQNAPLHQIISILIEPALDDFYKKANYDNLLKHLKVIAECVSNESSNLVDQYVEWMLKDLPASDSTLHLWAALAEVLPIPTANNDALICDFLLWPLRHLDVFTHVDAAALVWNTTYLNISLHKTIIDKDSIINKMLENDNSATAATYFRLCVLLATIKDKIVKKNSKVSDQEVQLLLDLTSKYTHNDNQFKQTFPILIDTLNLMLSAVTPPYSTEYLQNIFLITKNLLNVFNKKFKLNNICDNEIIILTLLNAIQPLFKVQEGIQFNLTIVDELLEYRSLCITGAARLNMDIILKSILSDTGTDQTTRAKIKAAMDNSENRIDDAGTPHKTDSKTTEPNECQFTTPVPKSTKKNLKKKETSIVNTVVENGEEFAVIKSNWKFNPRKLTENQKEKLQRKREDIPALYQDLSQSQDEFKLKSWKTDSQDASTTNSTSTTTPSDEDASKILKNMPCTDIVPKIIDNFFSEIPKSDTIQENKNTNSPQSKKGGLAKLSPSVKSPRMALKDRVFRNVRNLIEKSSVTKEGTKNPGLLNETISTNVFETPVTKCKETKNFANSAPSKISADRPARVKRKPRKFDDTEMYLLKKRRNSTNQYESQTSEMADSVEDSSEMYLLKKRRNSTNQYESQTSEMADSAEDSSEVYLLNKMRNSINQYETQTSEMTDSAEDSSEIVADVGASKITEPENLEKKNDENEIIESDAKKFVSSEPQLTPEAQPRGNQDAEVPLSVDKEKTISKNNDLENCKSNNDNQLNDSFSDVSVDEQTQSDESELKNVKISESTPKPTSKRKDSNEVKSSTKKKSRIEKELAIDMVEGHPFLKLQSEKRMTRKCLSNTPNSTRRKSLTVKLNKSKTEPKSYSKSKRETHTKDLAKENTNNMAKDLSVTVCETQDICPDATQDLSEDIIESSQDSVTTISAKSLKSSTKNYSNVEKTSKTVDESQNEIDNSSQGINTTVDVLISQENKDDSELPANKTAIAANITTDLTEEMDTEPIDDKCTSSGEVILINDEDDPINVLNTEDNLPGPDTLELANADTQPTDPSQFIERNDITENRQDTILSVNDNAQNESKYVENSSPTTADTEDRTITLSDITQNEDVNAFSPSKDEDQRKKDFLNNTLEISPIKTLSPIEPKSPLPETSSDFLVVKLSGPVQLNGEPLELSNSPEIFTEEKVSPDKRDQSPPRQGVTANNSSPSSSLSLKKNKPQVRSGGRAAQMLGLCVPDRLQTIMNIDRPEVDEPKKSNPINTPARRNLRMLYSSTTNDNGDFEDSEESENFLKFKRSLPTADCSPSGPILKRKLADIADDATVSPANKRKRVSFHDPVSTSVSVRKYIESSGVRSPQNSALKRLGRQIRNNSHMKSPKRLDNLFILDSVLTTAIASFNESDLKCNETPLSSLEQTPVVEIVKNSELNDTDPIFPALIDCKDSIQDIAAELSSPAMRLLLVKELEGNIETVGDLAKLTELEVNRLCIKAPKVEVVKKVLGDYASKKTVVTSEQVSVKPTIEVESEMVTCTVEVQTNVLTSETETQTSLVLQRISSTQTDKVATYQKAAQTNESGRKSTEDIIKSCLKDRKDFIEKLNEQLDEASKRKLASTLSIKNSTDVLVQKMTSLDTKIVLNRVIQREVELHSNGLNGNKELAVLQNYLSDKYDAKDLILLCSQLLQKVHDNGV